MAPAATWRFAACNARTTSSAVRLRAAIFSGSSHSRVFRPEGEHQMSLIDLEFEAAEIVATLEDMKSSKVANAIAAARALADALADAIELPDDVRRAA